MSLRQVIAYLDRLPERSFESVSPATVPLRTFRPKGSGQSHFWTFSSEEVGR